MICADENKYILRTQKLRLRFNSSTFSILTHLGGSGSEHNFQNCYQHSRQDILAGRYSSPKTIVYLFWAAVSRIPISYRWSLLFRKCALLRNFLPLPETRVRLQGFPATSARRRPKIYLENITYYFH